MSESPLAPPAVIGFVGLGNMGYPMVQRLLGAGFRVRGFDTSADAVAKLFGSAGFEAAADAADVATGADAVILMLPDSAIVEAVSTRSGLLDKLGKDAVLIDMSSSDPIRTRALADVIAGAGIRFIDAPVSGGVKGAVAGTLTVMVGGETMTLDHVAAVLAPFGRVVHCGDIGAGDAVKALNNLMSAAHLLASSEAILAGREFGLDPKTILDVVNGSSGRSGSTENKWPNFVLTGAFNSGFSMKLMVKDIRIALGLIESTSVPASLSQATVSAWETALEDLADSLPGGADHTDIARWLDHATAAHTDPS